MWQDRLTGKMIKQLPDSLESGRYCLSSSKLTFNQHTTNFSGVLVDDGKETCLLGDYRHSFLQPNKEDLAKVELFIRTIKTISSGDNIPVSGQDLVSPLMPAEILDEQSELKIFEIKLKEVLDAGHFHHISQQPRIDLQYKEQVTDIARAKRLAKDALVHLASHSECWQRQTLSGVVPKKVLARFSEDDFNIYENLLYARLLDKVERYLHHRITILEQLKNTLDEVLEFYETSKLNHFLTHEICSLWGKAHDSEANEQVTKRLNNTFEALQKMLGTIRGLKQSGLYLQVHRSAQVRGMLHVTNILSHDPHYRHVAILWNQLEINSKKSNTPEECYQENILLIKYYSHFAGLVLRHALEPYLGTNFNENWAGKKLKLEQVGLEWELTSHNQNDENQPTKVLLKLIPWLGFLKTENLPKANTNDEILRIIAWPALNEITNKQAYKNNWIALSPFDVYCVERLGFLVDHILQKQLVQSFAEPLEKIPTKTQVLVDGISAITVNRKNNQLTLQNTLQDSDLIKLKNSLISENARDQAIQLKLRQAELLQLQKCPVCSEMSLVEYQEPKGFKAECRCGLERYLRVEGERKVFEQILDKKTNFKAVGRRSYSFTVVLKK